MKIKCARCIHRAVCKFKPKEDYPQYMKRIVSENCKYYIETPFIKVASGGTEETEVKAVLASTKEKALKPEYEGDGYDDEGEIVYDTAYCPVCHHEYEVDYDDHDNYCRNCGQKLDWEENDNETD